MASAGKRWLIGCGVGCGAFLVLVVVLIVGFTAWIRGSGELLEPQKLLGADTTGYLEWTLKLDDPGTEGFVRELIRAAQALPPEASEELPAWLLNWLEQRQSAEAERDLLELFPMVAAWTLRPGASPADDLHLVSLSVERFGNRLRFGDWIMGWLLPRGSAFIVERYRNEKIYRVPIQNQRYVTFFIRNGNLFFTSDPDTARLAVDRLIASTDPAREPTDLDAMFARTEGGGRLRGAIANGRGELLRLWQSISARADRSLDQELWNGLRGVTVAGGLHPDGSLETTMSFICPDARWAEAHSVALSTALREGLAWTDLTLEIAARPAGERIEVRLRAPELVASIGGWIEHAREIETDSGTVRIEF